MKSLSALLLSLLTASSLVIAQTSTAAATTCTSTINNNIPQPSGAQDIDACPGSIPLGGSCGADEQCADDAQCWGSTAFTTRRCGNFNAACNSKSQCAFNSCNGGLCNGFLSSGSGSSGSPTTTPPLSGHAQHSGYPGSGYGNGTQPHGTDITYPSGSVIPQQPVGSEAERSLASGAIVAIAAGFTIMLV